MISLNYPFFIKHFLLYFLKLLTDILVLIVKFNGLSMKYYYRLFDDNIDFRYLSDLSGKIKSK